MSDSSIKPKLEQGDKTEFEFKLNDIREDINAVDEAICNMFAVRMSLVELIADLKKEHGVTEMSESRQHEIYNKLKEAAIKSGVSASMMRGIYDIVFNYSIMRQNIIMYESSNEI
jgi:chorismate mutase